MQAAPVSTPGGRKSLNILQQNRLPAAKVVASPTPAKFGGSVRAPVQARPSVTSTPGRAGSSAAVRRGGLEESSEIASLQAMIAEKNTKIASLTAEFDAHRADFRSTLDTLELASTETERVYEKKVEDLLQERELLLAQGGDVESVAQQLRQMEEVVQELEEGLEDARRGEAEARGEVEFLRGEVERVRAELRRERERNVDLIREVDEARRNRSRAKTSLPMDSGIHGTINEQSSRQITTSPALNDKRGTINSLESNKSSSPKSEKKHDPSSRPNSLRESTTGQEMKDRIEDSPTINQTIIAQPTQPAAQPAAQPVQTPPQAPELTVSEDDPDKWCALCEQDGHDSISCPFDKP